MEICLAVETEISQWTAILLAGQRPGGDPLADACGIKYKALIPIDGQTMMCRVADALLSSPKIGRVVIMAQCPDALVNPDTEYLLQDPRVTFVESNDGIATSVSSVSGTDVAPWPVLVTTADNALLTQSTIDTFLDSVSDNDIAIGVVDRETVMAGYPETKRTWLKFKGGAYSGANLFALANDKVRPALTLWSCVEKDRKKSWKIISCFGPYLLFRAITRTITFKNALKRAGNQMSLNAAPVNLQNAEAAIDVDKLSDLDLATSIVLRRKEDVKGEQSCLIEK